MGDRLIADWKLSCEPSHELPKAPGTGGRISRSSKRTHLREAPPPAWKIPQCRVYPELTVPRDPDGKIRVTFRQAGFKRVLSLFLRFPSNDVIVGDKVTLRLNKTELVMPVHDCHRAFCLVIESITKGDAGSLLTAKSLMLAFAARPSGKQIVISVPMIGLAPAIGAMHRIDRQRCVQKILFDCKKTNKICRNFGVHAFR
jgi:hypothetical protein